MPEVADSAAASGITRKEKFRRYFHSFNPIASPAEVLQRGLVLPDLRPENVHSRIAVRVELESSSLQAVVGGVGAGKTTELLLAQQHLHEQGIEALYIEVSHFADVSQVQRGFLVGIVCEEILRILDYPSALEAERRLLDRYLYGREVERTVTHNPLMTSGIVTGLDALRSFTPRIEKVFVRGVSARPLKSGAHIGTEVRTACGHIINKFKETKPLALLIDGLDRFGDVSEFKRVVLPDLLLLQQDEVPTVCVAPLALQFVQEEFARSAFDRIHELNAIPVSTAGALDQVIKLRDSQALMSETATVAVRAGSGGLLRDLITLARDAGEEAYISGSEFIDRIHADRAVRQLGVSYLRGLSPTHIELVKSVIREGGFDPSNGDMMFLLGSRRIVEFSSTSFSVHPALKQVL